MPSMHNAKKFIVLTADAATLVIGMYILKDAQAIYDTNKQIKQSRTVSKETVLLFLFLLFALLLRAGGFLHQLCNGNPLGTGGHGQLQGQLFIRHLAHTLLHDFRRGMERILLILSLIHI